MQNDNVALTTFSDKERQLPGRGSQSQKHDGRPGRAGQTDRCGNHAQGQQDFIPHGCLTARESGKVRLLTEKIYFRKFY